MTRMTKGYGFRTIKCPHCDKHIKVYFRTLHRLKLEVEGGGRG